MTPASPTFSVFIPVWNGARWIGNAIDSVLAQSYPDWELVIGDNASSDDLASVLAGRSDPRIRLHRWPTHVDLYENFNRTMLLCRNDWLVFLGADDRLHAQFLERAAERIRDASTHRADRTLAMVITACQRVDVEGRPAARQWYAHGKVAVIPDGFHDGEDWIDLTVQAGAIPWNFGSVALSREVLGMTGGLFRPEIGVCADMELILRLSAYGDIAYVDEQLMDFTVRGDSDGVGRISQNLASASPIGPMSAAYLAGLAVHEFRHGRRPREHRGVKAAVAREYLTRALLHRYHPGGRGRLGAVQDVIRAFRASPRTALSVWQLGKAAAALFAPVALIDRARATLTHRRRHDGPELASG